MITRNNSTKTLDVEQPSDLANFAWIMVLALAGVAGSLIISCVMPFAALAVALAGTVKLRTALRGMTAIWLMNQFIGFVFFHFPRTPNSVLWGFGIGAAAMLSTMAASIAIKRVMLPKVFRIGVALLLGYAIYEVTLFVMALSLGGIETFSPAIIAQLGLVNLFWLIGLVALNELVALVSKMWLRVTPRLLQAS